MLNEYFQLDQSIFWYSWWELMVTWQLRPKYKRGYCLKSLFMLHDVKLKTLIVTHSVRSCDTCLGNKISFLTGYFASSGQKSCSCQEHRYDTITELWSPRRTLLWNTFSMKLSLWLSLNLITSEMLYLLSVKQTCFYVPTLAISSRIRSRSPSHQWSQTALGPCL